MGTIQIIAEAGVNHNGSLELAKRLADMAKQCGADIVKFQTAKLSSLVSKDAKMAKYQKKNIGKEISQREMLKKRLLSYEQFRELASYCQKIGMEFLSTPFDIESIFFLQELGCKFWKIPSGEVTNYPYLKELAKTGKPILMSTGMCYLEEVEAAIKVLQKYGSGPIQLLHCTTEYPAPYEEVNLLAINTLKETFQMEVGYSDHTEGIEVAAAAVAMGAVTIEKHLTLDKTMEGPDHKASLEPKEFKAFVHAIRHIEKAMGTGEKRPTFSEQGNRLIARKSIIAKKDILKGEIFTEENITTKRPGSGISPMKWPFVLGRIAGRDFREDEFIEL